MRWLERGERNSGAVSGSKIKISSSNLPPGMILLLKLLSIIMGSGKIQLKFSSTITNTKKWITIKYVYLLLIIMMQRLEAMVWALDRINNSPNLLPNITLGILYPKSLTKKVLFNHVTSWSKFSYRILTILKLQLPNLDSWLKMLTNLWQKNLDQTLA